MNATPASSSLFRRRIAVAFGLCLALFSSGLAVAEPGTPAQRRACTPDVYRLCAGDLPNVCAITACLRRQQENLSEACKAVFERILDSAKALPNCGPR